MVNFAPLTRAQVLCALYNKAKVQGMGFLQFKEGNLTIPQAEKLIEDATKPSFIEGEKPYAYFDYVYGRVLKVELKEDSFEFEERLYDRDNGEGAAKKAIEEYLEKEMSGESF